jgi:hypothetical protein
MWENGFNYRLIRAVDAPVINTDALASMVFYNAFYRSVADERVRCCMRFLYDDPKSLAYCFVSSDGTQLRERTGALSYYQHDRRYPRDILFKGNKIRI